MEDKEGIALFIRVMNGEGNIKIKSFGCKVKDLAAMIAYCDIAKDDLKKKLKETIEKNKIYDI